MASTLVYIVRHGQTAENLLGIIQGQLDTQLDNVGRLEQAPAVAHALRDVPFDIGFTSDLARAADTADIIFRHHPGVELHVTKLLREKYMGNIQGHAVFPRESRPEPDDTVETHEAFSARALQFWDEMVVPRVKAAKGNPLRLLVVSHGAFINTIVRALVGHRNIVKAKDVTLTWVPNVSITLVEVKADGAGSLLKFGDVSHIMAPSAQRNADEEVA